MSTPQTDAHNEGQKNIIIAFDSMLQKWFDGEVDYDEVEEELSNAEADEDVGENTYRLMKRMWREARDLDEFWQSEETMMWSQLQKDQS